MLFLVSGTSAKIVFMMIFQFHAEGKLGVGDIENGSRQALTTNFLIYSKPDAAYRGHKMNHVISFVLVRDAHEWDPARLDSHICCMQPGLLCLDRPRALAPSEFLHIVTVSVI